MKHTVSLILVLFMLLFVLASCSSPHEHSFGDWVITKAATCTEAGLKERTCSCGEKEIESINPIGHSTRQGKCSQCGKFINELASVVNNLSDLVSNISLATNLIKNVYFGTGYTKNTYIAARDTYLDAIDPDIKSISAILDKYPEEFTEFRSQFDSMKKKIDNATKGWEDVDGFSWNNCQILQEVSSIFIEARPTLNGILGSYEV